jgi:hypothetical protein
VFPSRAWVVVIVAVGACAVGEARDFGSDDDHALPARTRPDDGGLRSDSSSTLTSQAPSDAGTFADADAATVVPVTGLDPNLKLPVGGATCSPPGSSCPGIEVCRIATSTQGRCEGCTSCGNLNAFCSANTDCDILFQCFKGRCTNICPLGTSYCGPVEDCVNVGHATHGVCRP